MLRGGQEAPGEGILFRTHGGSAGWGYGAEGGSRRRIHFRGGVQFRPLWILRPQRVTSAFRSMSHSGETALQDTLSYEAGEAPRAAAFGRPGGGEHPQKPAHPNYSVGLTSMHLPFVKQGSNAEKALP